MRFEIAREQMERCCRSNSVVGSLFQVSAAAMVNALSDILVVVVGLDDDDD